jgi:hypothetical protein
MDPASATVTAYVAWLQEQLQTPEGFVVSFHLFSRPDAKKGQRYTAYVAVGGIPQHHCKNANMGDALNGLTLKVFGGARGQSIERTGPMISMRQYLAHERAYDGYCTTCGDWTTGGVEPDAEGRTCESANCGEQTVVGAERAFITDAIEIEGE